MIPRRVPALAFTCAIVFGAAACTRVDTAAPGAVGGGGRSGHPNAWTKPGILRIANLSEPDTLNPLIGTQQIDSDIANFWAGTLLDYDDKNEYIPDLATAVPSLENGGISKDGKTIVYHLRPGVLWHDGKPFGADDVIFTWHAVMNKKNNVGSTVGYDVVAAIDKRDERTIAVYLKRPYAPFVATFFAPSASTYPILPAHLLAQYDNINAVPYNNQPIGTGPFIIERWQRGSKMVFKANQHYWRGPPKLKEIWYAPVPNENTIVTLLQSHEQDLEFNAAANNYAQVKSIRGFTTILTDFTQYGQLALNLRTPALSDVRVRRALWYALDVPRLIHDVSHDVNTPADTDQPKFLWAHNSDVARYGYDPAKAKALLDAAGWKAGADGMRTKNGQRLSLVIAGVSGSANGNAVDVLVQRNWHDVGVDAQVKLYTTALFFASFGAGGIMQTGKFDVGFFSWINGPDPDNSLLWMCDRFPPAGQNVYHFCNAALDRQERIALGSYDRRTRKKAYDAIQRIWADQVPAIIPWYSRRIGVVNSDLRNYRPAHAVSSFWNPYEWEI